MTSRSIPRAVIVGLRYVFFIPATLLYTQISECDTPEQTYARRCYSLVATEPPVSAALEVIENAGLVGECARPCRLGAAPSFPSICNTLLLVTSEDAIQVFSIARQRLPPKKRRLDSKERVVELLEPGGVNRGNNSVAPLASATPRQLVLRGESFA